MEDEVFEKYYLQIENVFSVFGDYDYDISEWKRKQKIKQILEEIENDSFRKGKTFKLKEEEFMGHFKEI